MTRAYPPARLGIKCVLEPATIPHPADAEPPPSDRWNDFRPPSTPAADLPIDIQETRESEGVVLLAATVVPPPQKTAWMSARFAAQPNERFYGFGERSDRVERSGIVTEHWVGEGPYQLEEYGLLETITPRWAIRRRQDATYFPIPWLLSSRGYGVVTMNTEISYHVLDQPGEWSVHVRAARLDLMILLADTPANALGMFTERFGRQPQPAATWFYGPWLQTGHSNDVDIEQEGQHVDTVLSAGAPIQAIETHLRYLPGGAHRDDGRRERERRRTGAFASRALPTVSYLNPMLTEDFSSLFEMARREGALQQGPDGTPRVFTGYVGGRNPPLADEAQLDFTSRSAEEIFASVAAELLEDGHSGWMEDFGEYTPLDARDTEGRLGEVIHNTFPVTFHAAAARVARNLQPDRPLARFARSGWTGAAPHLPLVWGGDPTTGWGFDGLRSALVEALTMGLSGISFWGTDIGGFFTLGPEQLTPELLIRWIQLGALCPLMRTKSAGVSIPPRERPQVWDPEILSQWVRWSRFHVALHPYLERAAEEYVRTGMPFMRHHVLTHPEDQVACSQDDQLMLGPDLLAAPVVEPGTTDRRLYLPEGAWANLLSGEISLGPAWIVVEAPFDRVPIFVREGASLLELESLRQALG